MAETITTTPELTAEQRFQKKINLTRKLSFADMNYTDRINEIQDAIDLINTLPESTSFLSIDRDGNRQVIGKLIVGDKNITDEEFGNNGEFEVSYTISVPVLEAKLTQLQEEKNKNREILKTILAPELLPEFDSILK